MSANDRQVGGDHYRQAAAAKGEQHWDRMWRLHGRGYFIGQITRYVERYHLKNGLQDLEKAEHYVSKLKELETAWADGTGPAPGETGSAPLPGNEKPKSIIIRREPEYQPAARVNGTEMESCCECGEMYPRSDLLVHNQIFCPLCRPKEN